MGVIDNRSNERELLVEQVHETFRNSGLPVFLLHADGIGEGAGLIIDYFSPFCSIPNKISVGGIVPVYLLDVFPNTERSIIDLCLLSASDGGYKKVRIDNALGVKYTADIHIFAVSYLTVCVCIEEVVSSNSNQIKNGVMICQLSVINRVLNVSSSILNRLEYTDVADFNTSLLANDYIYSDDFVSTIQYFDNQEKTCNLINVCRVKKKDGSYAWFSLSTIYIKNEPVHPNISFSFCSDITESLSPILLNTHDSYISVISNLSIIFFLILSYDKKTNFYHTIFNGAAKEWKVVESGNYSEDIDDFVDSMVHVDDVVKVRKFFSIVRFEKDNKFSQGYKYEKINFRRLLGDSFRWVQMAFLQSETQSETITITFSEILNERDDSLQEETLRGILSAKQGIYELLLVNVLDVLFDYDVIADNIEYSHVSQDGSIKVKVTEHYSQVIRSISTIYSEDIDAFLGIIRDSRKLFHDTFSSGSNSEVIVKKRGAIEIRASFSSTQYQWFRVTYIAYSDNNGENQRIFGRFDNIDKEKSLQVEAELDSLTELLNRKTLIEKVDDFFRSDDNTKDCALLMLDVDNLKIINDSAGHIGGDNALNAMSQTISDEFNQDSFVARMGGDEFCVFVKNTSVEEIQAKASNVLDTLSHTMTIDGLHGISCSIGIFYNGEFDLKTFEDLYSRADEALYKAKKNGKSQFVLYGDIKREMDREAKKNLAFLRKVADFFKRPPIWFFSSTVLVAFGILFIFLYIIVSYSANYFDDRNKDSYNNIRIVRSVSQMIHSLDTLSYNAVNYVSSCQNEYLDAYLNELTVHRGREVSLSVLDKMNLSEGSSLLLNKARINADSINNYENHAIKLMSLVVEADTSKFPNSLLRFPLSAEELSLTDAQKLQLARSILLSEHYMSLKATTNSQLIELSLNSVNISYDYFSSAVRSQNDFTVRIRRLLIMSCILGLFTYVWYFFTSIRPLKSYQSSIKSNKNITPSGTREMVQLGNSLVDYRKYVSDQSAYYIKSQKTQKKFYSDIQNDIINVLSSVEYLSNTDTVFHMSRVKLITSIILKYLLQNNIDIPLSFSDAELIANASVLHDFGRSLTRDEIRYDVSNFSIEDVSVITKRISLSREIISKFDVLLDSSLISYLLDICQYHFERSDGHGYPDGLKDFQIPIAAKVVSVAETFEDILSSMPTNNETILSVYSALNSGKYGVFASEVLGALKTSLPEIEKSLNLPIDN